jgi:hypothetical protein
VEIRRASSASITTAWTLTQPWTERAPSTAAWKTRKQVFHERADHRYPIAAKSSCALGDNAGALSCFIDSALKYRRSATAHSSPLDFFVQPFQRIRAVQLPLMFERQMPVRQDVFGGLLEQRRRLRKAAPQPVGHPAELLHRGRVIGLREDRPDNGRDRLARPLRHRCEQVAHDMHAAPPPRRPRPHRADRLLQADVRVRDDQANALETAFHKTPEKLRPETAILGRPDIDPQHLAVALAGNAHRDDRGLTDHATVDPHLVVRRIHPQITMLAGQRARATRRDDRVELAADS